MKKSIAILYFLLLAVLTSFAQQTHSENGWEAFTKNDLTSANEHFLKATAENPADADSWLMLSMIAANRENEADALTYFTRFNDLTEDINPYFVSYFLPYVIGFSAEKKTPQMFAFLNSLLSSAKLDLKNQAIVLEVLAGHYFHAKDLRNYNACLQKISSVSEWQITGPFENISESGFDKHYAPIDNPEANSVFKDKNLNEIGWFRRIETRSGKWVDLKQNFFTDNAIFYAQTFCNSPSEQEVMFRVGTSGSLKVWVNDKLLFSEPEERNNGLDTYLFTAMLNEGNNRILLQTGSSEITRNNFMFRISNLNEELITNLSFSASYKEYVKDTSDYCSNIITLSDERYLTEKIACEPENLLNYILLAKSFLSMDKTYHALQVIEQAQDIAPDCSYLLALEVEAYNRNDNYTLARNVLEKIKQLDPMSPLSLRIFINDAFRREEFTEAETLIGQYESVVGENENVLIYKIRLAERQKKNDLRHRLIDRAYKKYPENEYFVQAKYEKETLSNKRKAAGKVLANYLANNYSSNLIGKQALLYFESRDLSRGIKNLEFILASEPETISNYYLLGIFYQATHQYVKAISYFKTCQEFAPFVSVYYESEAKCQEELGNTALALIAYRKALRYNQSNIALKIKVRELMLKKPVFEYFDPVNIYDIAKKEIDIEKYPDDPFLVVHMEDQAVFFDGGGSIEKTYLVYKVLNAEGIDLLKEYNLQISYYDDLTIEISDIIKPSGSKLTAERYYDKLFFTSLEVGDVIIISYKTEKSKKGRFSDVIVENYYLNHFVPVLSSKISILVPVGLSFNIKNDNEEIEYLFRQPSIDFDMYVWETDELPKIKNENSRPSSEEILTAIRIRNVKDWDFYTDWFKGIIHNKIKPDYFVWKKSAELFDGKEDLSDYEKVQLIYEYVTSQISYSHTSLRQSGYMPQKASEVIASKMGDCKDVSGLFIALCATVGIDANYVLVSTRDNGLYKDALPSMVFNHTIVKVKIDDQEYFLELTSADLPFAALGHSTVGAFSLNIDPAKEKGNEPFYLNPENRVKNVISRFTQIELQQDSMIIACKSMKSGTLKSGMKSRYQNKSKSEQFNILDEIISNGSINAKLEVLDFKNGLYDLSGEVTYDYSYSDEIDITKAGNMEILNIKFTDELNIYSTLITKERTHPLELFNNLNYVDTYSEVIELLIPAGKSLVEVPENITVEDQNIALNLTFDLKDNKLIISRNIQIFKGRVEASDYQLFKEKLSTIIKSDSQKIVLVSKT